MSRLIVVSNRVATPGKNEAGGLAVALQEALQQRGGIWCGWSGKTAAIPKTHKQTVGNVDYLTMDIQKSTFDGFYAGYCNSLLWPMFHYQTGLMRHDDGMFAAYKTVNQQFAEAIAEVHKPGDTIWVHDYHLLLLGQALRNYGVEARTGFFLHIPFPVWEIFSTLPEHVEILKSLCAYDLIGFQTTSDMQAFLRCLSEVVDISKTLLAGSENYEVVAMGRKFQVGCFPISIDTKAMEKDAAAAVNTAATKKLRTNLGQQKLIIGVDRLDYSKGLPQRIRAFQHFLQTNPAQRGQVSYIQITPPSRGEVEEYRDIRNEVETLIGNINGMNSDMLWQPVRYLNTSFSRKELAGFYRSAAVGLVTPLRDGMNLVAKEYVASQNPEDPGVLILSQFAGAAKEFTAALIVNPYHIEDTAAQIQRALTMPLAERKERHADMIYVLQCNDIAHWTRSYLQALQNGPSHIVIFQSKTVLQSVNEPCAIR